MKRFTVAISKFLSERFNLSEDKADEDLIVENIRRDVPFKGTNLWTLIFAVFIASIGLNVNSTAVIIGAMLISPIMGPIMGMGLAIGINDFELLKKGLINLLIAVVLSVAASFLYFKITPLHEASSELLARTTPTIWDVFIAFLGGLAGIVAGTRKEKSNVIPGVAIATALMPPLCTAGFGLATGQYYFFLGAFYLFFINSLFICLATFLIVKHLKFAKKAFSSEEREKKVSRYILIIVTLTVLPSIYLAYRIVQRSIFESNADRFVKENFHFSKTQVVTKSYSYKGKQNFIELLLVGQPLRDTLMDSIKHQLDDYNLKNTVLTIHQGLDAKQKIDLSAIKASVLEEVYAVYGSADTLAEITEKINRPIPDIRQELRALYPALVHYSLSQSVFAKADTTATDTVTLFAAKFNRPISRANKKNLQLWLKHRLQSDSVKLIIE